MVLGTRQSIRSKQIDAYGRQRTQHNIPKPPNYRGKWKPWQWQHDPGADQPTETYNFWEWGQVTPKASPSQRLKEQFKGYTNPKNRPLTGKEWLYRPKPKDEEERRPFPPFDFPTNPPTNNPPDIPDIDIPVPPQDIVVDDPFSPIDEGEEAEDEGENVEDPPKDRFDTKLTCQDLELITGVPCDKGVALQIQTEKYAYATRNQFRKESRKKRSSKQTRLPVSRMGKPSHHYRKYYHNTPIAGLFR